MGSIRLSLSPRWQPRRRCRKHLTPPAPARRPSHSYSSSKTSGSPSRLPALRLWVVRPRQGSLRHRRCQPSLCRRRRCRITLTTSSTASITRSYPPREGGRGGRAGRWHGSTRGRGRRTTPTSWCCYTGCCRSATQRARCSRRATPRRTAPRRPPRLCRAMPYRVRRPSPPPHLSPTYPLRPTAADTQVVERALVRTDRDRLVLLREPAGECMHRTRTRYAHAHATCTCTCSAPCSEYAVCAHAFACACVV